MGIARLLPKAMILTLGAGLFVPFDSTLGVTLKPLVQGKRGVVAAGHPLVAEAGLRILERGGNAIDAGVATIFAASVVEGMSFASGGECPILIKPQGKPVVAINGAGIAPELATVDFYERLSASDPRRPTENTIPRGKGGTIPSFGPLSAVVPGCIDALLLTLENYGTMRLGEVIQPAIELTEGFPLDARLADGIAKGRPLFEKWPSSRRVYMPDGRLPKAGEIFVQADLARTFRSLAEAEQRAAQGRAGGIEAAREYFYRGPVARRIGDFCKEAGCLLREGDFAAYHAKIEQPLSTNYRGIEVYKVGFWSQGPAFLENLNILEGFDLKSMGHNSANYLHTVVETMKLGFADRDTYFGDPDFNPMPTQIVSKEYASVRRSLIDPQKASAEHIPGDPARLQARAPLEFARARLAHRNAEHQDTTCVNAIDKDGNMFSGTPSGGWVPAVIAGDTGIPLTQRAQSFVLTPGHPNQLAPHKRPRITLTPTIALKDGKPWLAFSTPGADTQDQTLLQIFLNVAEFGMNPQEAVEAPRVNTEAMYSSFDDHNDHPLDLSVEHRVVDTVTEQLQVRGHHIRLLRDWGNLTAPTMVEFNPVTGVISAGADVRGHRYALAW